MRVALATSKLKPRVVMQLSKPTSVECVVYAAANCIAVTDHIQSSSAKCAKSCPEPQRNQFLQRTCHGPSSITSERVKDYMEARQSGQSGAGAAPRPLLCKTLHAVIDFLTPPARSVGPAWALPVLRSCCRKFAFLLIQCCIFASFQSSEEPPAQTANPKTTRLTASGSRGVAPEVAADGSMPEELP